MEVLSAIFATVAGMQDEMTEKDKQRHGSWSP